MESESVIREKLTREILTRLPIKCLGRFRCVCKRWRSIISDPLFVDLHHSRSPTSLFISLRRRYGWERYFFSITDGTFRQCHGLDSWTASQPVNGLVCFYAQHGGCSLDITANMCNPATGQGVSLPRSAFSSPWQLSDYQNLYLGFHPCTNTYKILRVWSSYRMGSGSRFEILTVGTGVWRIIKEEEEDGPTQSLRDSKGVCINGTLYWAAAGRKRSVTALDVGEETFRAIPIPPGAATWDPTTSDSFQMGGQLAVAEFGSGTFMAIWKLEDSVNGVWSHRRIPFPEWLVSRSVVPFSVACSSEDGIIALISMALFKESCVVCCEVETQRFWRQAIFPPPRLRLDDHCCPQLCEFKESFTSVKRIYRFGEV